MKLFASIAFATLATTSAALAQDAAPAPAPAPAAPAAAQELKGPSVGATVYGPADEAVGTIESISGNVAVLSTGTNKLSIPLDRLGKGPNGPTIGLGKAELDALATQASAQAATQLKEKLVPGAQIRGSAGTVLGTVKGVTAEAVTVATTDGKQVNMPIAAVGVDAQGLVIGLTAEQFQAAVDAAAK